MKTVILGISLVLLIGCKNVLKDQPIVEKPTTHLIESKTQNKPVEQGSITVQEVPVNVKMESAPVSSANKVNLKEITYTKTNVQTESSVRPEPEAQPVPSNISANSSMALTYPDIIFIALCVVGLLYLVIKNGKK